MEAIDPDEFNPIRLQALSDEDMDLLIFVATGCLPKLQPMAVGVKTKHRLIQLLRVLRRPDCAWPLAHVDHVGLW